MLTLTDDPDPHLEDVLGDGLAEYNTEMSRQRDWRALAVKGTTPTPASWTEGCSAAPRWVCFPRPVLLPKKLRGGGIGSPALRMAEQRRRRGCRRRRW